MLFARCSLIPTLLLLLFGLPTDDRSKPDPSRLLREADRLAMLYNWPKAAPLYAQAEALFTRSGDQKDALSARLGRIRAQIDTAVISKLDNEVEEGHTESPGARGCTAGATQPYNEGRH
jgi:hypothetical protein